MNKRNTISVTMTINKDLHKKMASYAAAEERSISFVAKKAIEMYLDDKLKVEA